MILSIDKGKKLYLKHGIFSFLFLRKSLLQCQYILFQLLNLKKEYPFASLAQRIYKRYN